VFDLPQAMTLAKKSDGLYTTQVAKY